MFYYISVAQAKLGRVMLLQKSADRITNVDDTFGKGIAVEYVGDNLPFGVVYDSVNNSVRAASVEERKRASMKRLYAGIGLLGKVWTKDDFDIDTFVKKTGDTMTGDLVFTNGATVKLPHGTGTNIYLGNGNTATVGKTNGQDLIIAEGADKNIIKGPLDVSGMINAQGGLNVGGSLTVQDLNVKGKLVFDGSFGVTDLDVTGELNLSGGITTAGTIEITNSIPLKIPYNSGIYIYLSNGAMCKMGRTIGQGIILAEDVDKSMIKSPLQVDGSINCQGIISNGRITGNQLESTGNLTVNGTASVSNSLTAGSITSNGKLTANSISCNGVLNVSGNITGGSSITARSIECNGGISASSINCTGTLTAGQLRLNGNLNVNGNINATGDVTGMSDRRIKKDIVKIDDYWNVINNINGYKYKLKKDNSDHVGLISQEVETVLPAAVSENSRGYKSIAYGNLAGVFVEALKDVYKRLEKLEGDV